MKFKENTHTHTSRKTNYDWKGFKKTIIENYTLRNALSRHHHSEYVNIINFKKMWKAMIYLEISIASFIIYHFQKEEKKKNSPSPGAMVDAGQRSTVFYSWRSLSLN